MNSLKKKRESKTQLLNAALEASMFLFCYAILVGVYAIVNVGMQRISRTSITVSIAYLLSLVVFTGVYGSFRIGVKRKRTLFSNQVCKILFSDLIAFIILQIMNTNPQNPEANPYFRIFDRNLPLTLLALIFQCAATLGLMELGFWAYYRLNPVGRCLIVAGSQEDADHLAVRMSAYPRDFRVTEAVSEDCPDLAETLLDNDVVAIGKIKDETKREIIRFCYDQGITLYTAAHTEDILSYTAEDVSFLDTLFLRIQSHEPTMVQRFFKRGFDIVFSLFLLILLSPLLLAIVIVLKCSHNGSVIFRQERRTRYGRIFKIMKFRTMYVDTAENVSMQKNDDRVTPAGKFLRRYRLDELPQLINILRGDMSIVGPRPEMLDNVERYVKIAPEFHYREKVRAGITGLAQLEGAYDTSPQDKAILDMLYIEKFSLSLDIKLILRTFTVFFRKDNEGFSKQKESQLPLRTTAKERGVSNGKNFADHGRGHGVPLRRQQANRRNGAAQ